MPAHGGKREGAGRRVGSKGKRSKAMVAATEAKKKVLVKKLGGFKGDAVDLMMAVYMDEGLELQLRLDAAKAAAPYERPRLSTIEMSGKLTVTHEERLKELE